MDCAGVASRLVPYHFAALAEDERDAVAEHLLGCRACLGTYLALKHAAERGPLDRPSPRVRARLREDVARAFAPTRAGGPRLFARRIPLYQGVVAAALAAAIALFVPRIASRLAAADVREGAPEVDTSRARAESLQIY